MEKDDEGDVRIWDETIMIQGFSDGNFVFF